MRSQDLNYAFFGEGNEFTADALWLLDDPESRHSEIVKLCHETDVPWQQMLPVFRAGTVSYSLKPSPWFDAVIRPIRIGGLVQAHYVLAALFGLLEGGCWLLEKNLRLDDKEGFYQTIACVLYHGSTTMKAVEHNRYLSPGDLSNRLNRFVDVFHQKGEDATTRIVTYYLDLPRGELSGFEEKVFDAMSHVALSRLPLSRRLEMLRAESME